MFQDQDYHSTANWQIMNGMTVYATDGTKLGTVRNYNPQEDWLDIHKGVLFTKDFYVPLEAIDTVAEDGITLRLTKDDLESDRFNSPPTAPSAAAVYEEKIVVTEVPSRTDQMDEVDTFDRVTSAAPPSTR
jgi:hypothetical protein